MANIGFDIETRSIKDIELLKRLEPEFKQPRITKDGKPHASDKSIEEQREDWLKDCALSPLTGEVCMLTIDKYTWSMPSVGEKELLIAYWSIHEKETAKGNYMVSFGRFDIDYIITRSRILGVQIPCTINPLERYIPMYIDMQDVLCNYSKEPKKRMIALETYAIAFGHAPLKYKKHDGKDVGENFGWFLDNHPDIAIAHNQEDVEVLNFLISKTLTK